MAIQTYLERRAELRRRQMELVEQTRPFQEQRGKLYDRMDSYMRAGDRIESSRYPKGRKERLVAFARRGQVRAGTLLENCDAAEGQLWNEHTVLNREIAQLERRADYFACMVAGAYVLASVVLTVLAFIFTPRIFSYYFTTGISLPFIHNIMVAMGAALVLTTISLPELKSLNAYQHYLTSGSKAVSKWRRAGRFLRYAIASRFAVALTILVGPLVWVLRAGLALASMYVYRAWVNAGATPEEGTQASIRFTRWVMRMMLGVVGIFLYIAGLVFLFN